MACQDELKELMCRSEGTMEGKARDEARGVHPD